jgi:hypothetical protein
MVYRGKQPRKFPERTVLDRRPKKKSKGKHRGPVHKDDARLNTRLVIAASFIVVFLALSWLFVIGII